MTFPHSEGYQYHATHTTNENIIKRTNISYITYIGMLIQYSDAGIPQMASLVWALHRQHIQVSTFSTKEYPMESYDL